MSVQMEIIVVMLMLCVPTLMGAILAHVNLVTLEME